MTEPCPKCEAKPGEQCLDLRMKDGTKAFIIHKERKKCGHREYDVHS